MVDCIGVFLVLCKCLLFLHLFAVIFLILTELVFSQNTCSALDTEVKKTESTLYMQTISVLFL